MKSSEGYRWLSLAIIFAAQWCDALISQSAAPLAPLFQAELGLTRAEVGALTSATYLGMWVVLVLAGPLADRFGVRWVVVLGLVVAGGSMLAMPAVGPFPQAVAVMLAAGLGRGAITPGLGKAIMDWFPPRSRATAMGLKQTGVPLAGIAAAAILPTVGIALGWRTALAAAGLVVLVVGLAAAALYREAPGAGIGTTRGVTALGSLRLALRNRDLWVASAIALPLGAGQMMAITYMALYFKESLLATSVPEEAARVVAAGGYLALFQLGGVFARVFWGVASDRLFRGRRAAVLALVAGLSAVTLLWAASLGPASPGWVLGVGAFACGATVLGWGGLYMALVVERAGARHAATGVALSMTLSQAGNVVGPPLFGFVVDVTGSYRAGWLLVSALYAAGAVAAAAASRGEKAAASGRQGA